jgi:squalene-hopene cyclase-like protein
VKILAAASALVLAALALAAGRAALAARGGEGPTDGAHHDDAPVQSPEVTPRLQESVRRGIRYLVAAQDKDSGSFGGKDGKVAITALACLALMANGNTDTGGAYNTNVASALRFLIRKTNRTNGYISTEEDQISRMHGHGYATLALAEAYGMFGVGSGKYGGVPVKGSVATPDNGDAEGRALTLRDALQRAIRCIENSQASQGGWYYEPDNGGNHEGSVTICELQALRSARNAGIAVKSRVIQKAVEYLSLSQNPNGSFAYSLNERRSSVALTGAALATLNALGDYDSPVVLRGMDYLTQNFESSLKTGEWYFYGNMYAAQAFFQARDTRLWNRYFPLLRDDVLERQQDDGGWDLSGSQWRSYGPVYSTACALLILQIPFRYLPIFQR